LVLAV